MSEFIFVDNVLMKKIYSLLIIFVLIASVTGCKKNKKDSTSVEVTKYSAETLYNKAKKYMDLGMWDAAIFQYKHLRNQYPFGRHAEQGTLELAYSYFKNYDTELAISTLDRFIKNYPAHEHIDYAYYLKGLVYFESEKSLMQRVNPDPSMDRNIENGRQAFVALKTFIERYPKSRYAEDAEQRLVYLRNYMAAYELQVAKYYLRRQAYVAAINRCKFVIESFQESNSVADALAVSAEAYKQLGQSELADANVAVLEKNFPNHSYLQGGELDLETKIFSFKDLWIFGK